jgi:hypothetical protein
MIILEESLKVKIKSAKLWNPPEADDFLIHDRDGCAALNIISPFQGK